MVRDAEAKSRDHRRFELHRLATWRATVHQIRKA